jgi:hypothetical protein
MSEQQPASLIGSLDGTGAGDHDQAYTFGRRPCLEAPFPFSTRVYARLLVLRSKLEAVGQAADDLPTQFTGPDPVQVAGARAAMADEP